MFISNMDKLDSEPPDAKTGMDMILACKDDVILRCLEPSDELIEVGASMFLFCDSIACFFVYISCAIYYSSHCSTSLSPHQCYKHQTFRAVHKPQDHFINKTCLRSLHTASKLKNGHRQAVNQLHEPYQVETLR